MKVLSTLSKRFTQDLCTPLHSQQEPEGSYPVPNPHNEKKCCLLHFQKKDCYSALTGLIASTLIYRLFKLCLLPMTANVRSSACFAFGAAITFVYGIQSSPIRNVPFTSNFCSMILTPENQIHPRSCQAQTRSLHCRQYIPAHSREDPCR